MFVSSLTLTFGALNRAPERTRDLHFRSLGSPAAEGRVLLHLLR